MRRYLILVLLFLICTGQGAQGQNIFDLGVKAKQKVVHISERAVDELLFRDTVSSFSFLLDLVTLHLADTGELVSAEFVTDRSWLHTLKNEGIISAGIVDTGEERNTVGEAAFESSGCDRAFYIDDRGKVHYCHSRAGEPLSFDITLQFNGLKEYTESIKRPPVSLFLYDTNRKNTSTLFGKEKDLHQRSLQKAETITGLSLSIALRNIPVMRKVDIRSSDIILIALYPFRVGSAVRLLGLIAIVLLTILLVGFAVYYGLQSLRRRGVVAMGEEEKSTDVVSEIEKELSGIAPEKEKPKKEEAPAPPEKDESLKRLADDGIYINK